MTTNAETLPARIPGHRIPQSMMVPVEPYYRPQPISRLAPVVLFLTMLSMFAFGLPPWMLATALIGAVMLTGTRREGASAIAKNQRAIEFLNNGNVHDAAREFEQLARTQTRQAAHAVYVFNRGVAYLLDARLQRAMSLFNAVEHSQAFERGPNRNYGPYLHAEMATCLALMGLIAEAGAHRERARQSLEGTELHRLVFVDAVVALRREDPRTALRVLDQYWDAAFENLRPPSFRGLMVIRAYALHLLRQEGGQFEGLMRATEPTRPGEFNYLAVEWPEMRSFLTHYNRIGGRRA